MQRTAQAIQLSKDKLERVKHCILNHSSLARACGASPEEACLANADIMSLIAKPDYWVKISSLTNQGEENSNWFYEQIAKSWPLMMAPARAINGRQIQRMKKQLHHGLTGQAPLM